MQATARHDITMKMLDSQADWYDGDAVAVPAGTRVTFVDNPDISETELVIDISKKAGAPWFWTVPHYWFTDFDDLPTWDKLVEMLHENGFTFSATFDSYRLDGDIDRPVMNLNFYRDDGSKDDYRMGAADAAQAVGLMNNRWTGLTPVYAVDGCEVFVTALPAVYIENVGKLLGDIREFLSSHRELVDDFIDTAGDEEDELVWGRIKNTIADLLNRIEKVQHNG